MACLAIQHEPDLRIKLQPVHKMEIGFGQCELGLNLNGLANLPPMSIIATDSECELMRLSNEESDQSSNEYNPEGEKDIDVKKEEEDFDELWDAFQKHQAA